MDNYVYIVAGLPELTSGFESAGFDYAAVKESIMELLSEKDQQLVELMEDGFDENSLGADFYAKAAESKNRFIREYFDFDGRLRNMKVNYLAKRLGKESDPYLVNLEEADFEENPRDSQRCRLRATRAEDGRAEMGEGQRHRPHGLFQYERHPCLSRQGQDRPTMGRT